jgi:hypothetical protein
VLLILLRVVLPRSRQQLLLLAITRRQLLMPCALAGEQLLPLLVLQTVLVLLLQPLPALLHAAPD